MEIGNIQNQGAPKAEELKEAKALRSRSINAYAKAEQGDSVDVSSKAKLLHKLRESYDKLPDAKGDSDVAVAKEELESSTVKMSSEEIVSSILKGTLFEVI